MAPLVEIVNTNAFYMADIEQTVLLARSGTARFKAEYAKLKKYMDRAIGAMPAKKMPAARHDEDDFDARFPARKGAKPPPRRRRALLDRAVPQVRRVHEDIRGAALVGLDEAVPLLEDVPEADARLALR